MAKCAPPPDGVAAAVAMFFGAEEKVLLSNRNNLTFLLSPPLLRAVNHATATLSNTQLQIKTMHLPCARRLSDKLLPKYMREEQGEERGEGGR